mgnify:FL=1
MKKKKTLLIVIIVLIVWILIIGGIVAFLFLGTDLFKSDKELFAKYVASMTEKETGFFPISLNDYENRKMNNAYEVNGTFSVNTEILATANSMQSSSTDQSSMAAQLMLIESLVDYGNNTNISYSGKVDNQNKKVEQNIQINYQDGVSLPLNYKQVGDVYGLQADFVSSDYIAIENNNLPALLQKLGATNITNVPNKIEIQEIESLNFTDEEKQHIYDNYVANVLMELSDDKFTKTENNDGSVSYTLTLSVNEVKDLLVKELQILSEDTMMIDKINNIFQEVSSNSAQTITSQDILDLVDEMNVETTTANDNFVITVTQNSGEVNSLVISTTDMKVSITKNVQDSNLSYTIAMNANIEEIGEIVFSFDMSYSGINTDNVSETYKISANIPQMANVEYTLNNNVNFSNSVNIDDFDTNTIILNDDNYSSTEIQNFMTQVVQLVMQKNIEQMQQIGYPTEMVNPMAMWVVGPGLGMYMYSSQQGVMDNTDLSAQEILAYNSQFTQYEGTISGIQVNTLISTIRAHNNSNISDYNSQIQITNDEYDQDGNDTVNALTAPATYDDIVNNINTGSTYVVTFAYDPTTGYVTSCGIVEQGSGLTNSLVNSNSTITNTLTDTTNTAGGVSNLITNAENFLNSTN